MIARIWKGRTRRQDADRYLSYLQDTGIRDYQATAGNRGVVALRRHDGAETELLLLSLWESEDAILRFAGKEIDVARYYPEDEAYLLELTPRVEHFQVVHQTATEPEGSHRDG